MFLRALLDHIPNPLTHNHARQRRVRAREPLGGESVLEVVVVLPLCSALLSQTPLYRSHHQPNYRRPMRRESIEEEDEDDVQGGN